MLLNKWKLLKFVNADCRLNDTSRRVMFYLLDRANNKTGKLFPSQQRIADDANISLISARRGIKKLIDCGYLVRNVKGYPGRSNDYSIDYRSVEFLTEISTDRNIDQNRSEHRSALIPQFTNNQLNELTNKSTERSNVVDLKDMVKHIAKIKSIKYREVVDSGRTYHQNMEYKYRNLMVRKLSRERYADWIDRLNDEETHNDALNYAKMMCNGK
jgi:DNA-binding MarR family transcriptional regulator